MGGIGGKGGSGWRMGEGSCLDSISARLVDARLARVASVSAAAMASPPAPERTGEAVPGPLCRLTCLRGEGDGLLIVDDGRTVADGLTVALVTVEVGVLRNRDLLFLAAVLLLVAVCILLAANLSLSVALMEATLAGCSGGGTSAAGASGRMCGDLRAAPSLALPGTA